MSDFFSRIFAIPSDVSSADEDTNFNYEEGDRRHRKIKHTRTLTPLSLTDGNADNNTTTSSFVENTVSYDQSQFSTDDTDSQEINGDIRDSSRLAPKHNNTTSSRGRQRRNDTSVGNRSASAEPRSPKKKPQRSSSMALPRNNNNNVQLQLTTSPRHRSLSKMGRSSSTSHRRTSSKELRNNSYSSGDDDIDKSPRSSRRSSSAYNNSSGNRQYSSSRSKSHQPNRMDSCTNSSTTSPKKEKKKKDNWRSTKWVKKHLSSPSNTPPKNKDGKKGKTKSSRKEKKKHHHNSSSHARDTKLSLLPPNQLRPAPVNVGDSIIISQQFLEDNADMSVLTMPKDLMSVISTENEKDEVAQEDEKNHSFDTELQKEVGQLQAYLKDRRIRHQHRSTTNHTTDGSSSRPVHYQKMGAYANRIQEEHVYSYNQDAQEIALGQQHIDDDIPPPPPPPRPSPLSRRKTSTSTQNAAIPHWNTPVTSNSESVASYDDPTGELVTSPTLQQTSTATFNQLSQHQHNGHHERSKSDPPGEEYQPFDEVSYLKNNGHDIQQHASPSSKQPTVESLPTPNRRQTQPTPNRLHKAVSFSLPPAPLSSSMKTPPAPPFMGPALDYYYSMERNSNITNTQSPLLPPIIELWSSVESTTIQNNTGKWDTQKEDELLGEELPLHVSEDWIDVRDKESDMITEEKAHADLATSTSLPVDTAASKRQIHSQFVDEDMVDDEFHDILDCGEDSIERSNKTIDDEVPADEAALDGDANLRHRSTWSTTYKPPTASTTFDEPGYDDLHNSDNWQEVVRQRSHAAISIQRSMRGLLERERLRSLLNSTLIIQTCIRKYIARRRYQNYQKLKISYAPKRWKEIAIEI